MNIEEACLREVADLHVHFGLWFGDEGTPRDDVFARIESALLPGFEIIGPGGAHVQRAPLIEGLRSAHGQYAGGSFEIEIKNVRVRTLADGLYCVTYEEWQQGGNEDGGRLSTAILRQTPYTETGLAWVHVHETWLPNRGL